jgi:hypothetical protein
MTRAIRRPIFVLRLRAEPGADAVRKLRALLKTMLRRYRLRCLDARTTTDASSNQIANAFTKIRCDVAARRRHLS